MADERIFVIAAGKNITIQPTRQFFAKNSAALQLRWLAQGNGVTVGNVDFATKSPTAPISNLKEDPNQPGEWIGTWDGTVRGVFQYAIQVMRDGSPIGDPVDPEIENDPPSGEEDGGG